MSDKYVKHGDLMTEYFYGLTREGVVALAEKHWGWGEHIKRCPPADVNAWVETLLAQLLRRDEAIQHLKKIFEIPPLEC